MNLTWRVSGARAGQLTTNLVVMALLAGGLGVTTGGVASTLHPASAAAEPAVVGAERETPYPAPMYGNGSDYIGVQGDVWASSVGVSTNAEFPGVGIVNGRAPRLPARPD